MRHQNGRIHDEKAENCDKIGRNEPKRDAEENLCGHDRVEKHSRLDFVIIGGVKKVDEGAEGKECQHSATHHFPRGEQFKVRQAEREVREQRRRQRVQTVFPHGVCHVEPIGHQ